MLVFNFLGASSESSCCSLLVHCAASSSWRFPYPLPPLCSLATSFPRRVFVATPLRLPSRVCTCVSFSSLSSHIDHSTRWLANERAGTADSDEFSCVERGEAATLILWLVLGKLKKSVFLERVVRLKVNKSGNQQRSPLSCLYVGTHRRASLQRRRFGTVRMQMLCPRRAN